MGVGVGPLCLLSRNLSVFPLTRGLVVRNGDVQHRGAVIWVGGWARLVIENFLTTCQGFWISAPRVINSQACRSGVSKRSDSMVAVRLAGDNHIRVFSFPPRALTANPKIGFRMQLVVAGRSRSSGCSLLVGSSVLRSGFELTVLEEKLKL